MVIIQSRQTRDHRASWTVILSLTKQVNDGQWLWLSWQSSRFQFQRSVVRIQSLAKKTEIKKKEAGNGPFFKKKFKNLANLIGANLNYFILQTTFLEILTNSKCDTNEQMFYQTKNQLRAAAIPSTPSTLFQFALLKLLLE